MILSSGQETLTCEKCVCSSKLINRVVFSQKTEKTEFLSFFYKYCMHVLTAPLLANTAHDKNPKGELRTAAWHTLPDKQNLTDCCPCHGLTDLQEGSTKINPVCPGVCLSINKTFISHPKNGVFKYSQPVLNEE